MKRFKKWVIRWLGIESIIKKHIENIVNELNLEILRFNNEITEQNKRVLKELKKIKK